MLSCENFSFILYIFKFQEDLVDGVVFEVVEEEDEVEVLVG